MRWYAPTCSTLLTNGSSEYLNMERQWHDRSPYVNQSLFNPEWVYGVRVISLPKESHH
jgi:hypothetical protein